MATPDTDLRVPAHIALVAEAGDSTHNGKTLTQKATGQFYTPETIGRRLAESAARLIRGSASVTTIADPFCGDGRLVEWVLDAAAADHRRWRVALWDCDAAAVPVAVSRIESAARRLGLECQIEGWVGNAFARADARCFDVVITNAPWDLLKPDRRELALLGEQASTYVEALRDFDRSLVRDFPDSQPARRFAGWGTNLSRVGTELAERLTAADGVCAVVAPASLFGDSNSERLRARLFRELAFEEVTYYPAEARLFKGVDVPCVTFAAARRKWTGELRLTRIATDGSITDSETMQLDGERLRENEYVLPVSVGATGVHILESFEGSPQVQELEHRGVGGLWAGRELDETAAASKYLATSGGHPFVKGVDVTRLRATEQPKVFVDPSRIGIPPSVRFPRLVWRDVSRPNQKRRMQASLIPPGWVTGNSLGVAHMRDAPLHRLASLLGIFSSLAFEFQLRSLLSTGHVSLSSIRRVRIPAADDATAIRLADLTTSALGGDAESESLIEIAVARAYGLERDAWDTIVSSFPKLSSHEVARLQEAW